MDKEHIQRLASDKTHIRHIALEFAGNWLYGYAERIIETELAKYETEDDEGIYDAFFEPVQAAIEQIAQELQTQAKDVEKGCAHTPPDSSKDPNSISYDALL